MIRNGVVLITGKGEKGVSPSGQTRSWLRPTECVGALFPHPVGVLHVGLRDEAICARLKAFVPTLFSNHPLSP